ncbi:MAG TPA: T9SS type A sorting domain-containing protein [Bacteroidia bacterium]|nr:T9SS type A sorting domain-containing protein [Bacteroidia bacterium]
MRRIILVITLLPSLLLFAQNPYSNPKRQAKNFKDLQREFNTFKSHNDLSQQKHWKHFKRWAYEMDFHTDCKGEPAGYEDYINAAIAASAHKLQNNSSYNWMPSGPNVLPNNLTGYMENGMGRINCISFHPSNPSVYYVGVAQGGIWKTVNNGQNWTPLGDQLPITRISDICIDPVNPNTIYIAVGDYAYIGVSLFLNGRKRHTHYGLGVYKSIDGGNTWSATALSFQLTNGDASLIKKILINPGNTNQVLACGANGMYKSLNGGNTWTHVLDSMFWDMQQDPVNPNIVYAATGWIASSNIGNAAIYKSTDFGSSWTMLNTGMPATGAIQRIKLSIAPSDANCIYALCSDDQGGFSSGLYGLYKSTNAGLTWTLITPVDNILEAGQGNSSGGQGTYDLALLVHPTNKNIIYTGGVNIWGSVDGGQTFNPASHWTTSYGPTLHGDIHAIAYQNSTGQYFVCSDGGVYRTSAIQLSNWSTSNWPTIWYKLNSNMQITSFYRLSSSKNGAGRLLAGAQDNASLYFENGSWSTVFGGDGMDNYLNPLDNDDLVGSSQYGNLYRSSDDGQTSLNLWSNPNGEMSEWVTPIVADYNHPGVLYAGNENIAKSTDGGNTWAVPGTIFSNTVTLSNTEISALAVSNTNSQVIYAARRVRYEYGIDGIVFRSTNGGQSYTNITSNLPDSLYFTGLEVSHSDQNTVYICMAGFSAGNKVFKSTNGGQSWQNISYNLPNIPINCIKQIPGSNALMIACDFGVYVLNNASVTWVDESGSLPNVIISDIEFNSALNKVYVSSFGRGIWESVYSPGTGINPIIGSNRELLLYPNPNSGHFTLEFPNANFDAEVVDVMGRNVFATQHLKSGVVQFDLHLPPGLYFLKLRSEGQTFVKRFVIE